jgi:Winged helix DNA-binding domain
MPGPRLDRRALNRALLARQMLLCRVAAPAPAGRAQRVLAAVGQLAGLQAQAPFPPYFGLWSRLVDFRPAELAELITGRRVVRIALMRGTIHTVTAADCLTMRPLIQPVLDRGLRANFGRQLAGVDLASLAAAGRELAGAATVTVELFRPVSSRDGAAIAEEGERLLGFAVGGTAGHDIRIVNLS